MKLAALSLVLAAAVAPEATSVSLDECVKLALEKNPDVLSAAAEVDAAKAERNSTAAMLGPTLHVDAASLHWSDAFTLPFGPTPTPPGPPIPAPVVVRAANTRSMTVTAAQPITPLLAIFEGVHLQNLGVDVAEIERDAARRNTTYAVTEAFYRLLEAKSLESVSKKSVEEVSSQVERATKYEKQGLIGKNDVLRAQIALAGANQRQIGASGAVALSSARLATLIGMPAGTLLTPTGAPERAASPVELSADEAESRAVSGRAELKMIDSRIEQARAARSVAWLRFAPTVSAIGVYQYTYTGAQLQFQQENSRYVGLVVSWTPWDWGGTYFGTRTASARVRQAIEARQKVRDAIALDARAAHVSLASALEGLKVAEAAVAQAEENYRIETKRYEANTITTFDVLDAEALLTQSRAQYQTALYDSHIAAANLRRAMGEEIR